MSLNARPRCASFGVLFQSGALWSSMTLAENVGLPLASIPTSRRPTSATSPGSSWRWSA